MDIELIMKFINENIVWVSVGAVVIIMALIGFVAEKTDFGRKPKVEKAPKKPKHLKEDDGMFEELDDEPNVQPVALPTENIEQVQEVSENSLNEQPIDEVFETVEEVIQPVEKIDNSFVEETIEEISNPIVEEPIEQVFETADESMGEPVALEVIEEINEELVPEVLETSEAPILEPVIEEEAINAPLPELDNITNEEENADEASDWKF